MEKWQKIFKKWERQIKKLAGGVSDPALFTYLQWKGKNEFQLKL
jgi:hypothetical protein